MVDQVCAGLVTLLPRPQLANWTGRALLLGAVAFWWGAIVIPRLVNLAFPNLLPRSALPLQLNPDAEGSIANTVSVACLLSVALLALGNTVVSRRRALAPTLRRLKTQDWTAAGGWAALAVTAGVLAYEEIFELKVKGIRFAWKVFGKGYGDLWTVFVSPLAAGFVLAMAVFVLKGLRDRKVRALMVLGVVTWLLVLVHEVSSLLVFGSNTNWYWFGNIIEETLEFGGTLLFGLSAGISLGGEAASLWLAGVFRGRRLFWLAVGSTAVAALFVALVVFVNASNYREPLVDTRGHVVLNLRIYDNSVEEHSLVQELGVLPAPLARLRLRVTNRDPQGRSGVMLWRITEAGEGGSGPILREGRVTVPAEIEPQWVNIDFPPIVEAKGRPLAVQLIAEVERGAHLRVGGTKTNSSTSSELEHLRFWVNGMKTWPDQKLELVAYGPSDLTLSKLQAIWRTFRWTWVVLAGLSTAGLWIITFIPALLVTAALPRQRPSPFWR